MIRAFRPLTVDEAAAVHLLTQDTCLRRNLDAVLGQLGEARRAGASGPNGPYDQAGAGANRSTGPAGRAMPPQNQQEDPSQEDKPSQEKASLLAAYLPFVKLVNRALGKLSRPFGAAGASTIASTVATTATSKTVYRGIAGLLFYFI